jgi:lysozyme family protein
MLSVRSIAEEIVAREGGYVNDPDDPGGPTKFGVTIHTMRGGWALIWMGMAMWMPPMCGG